MEIQLGYGSIRGGGNVFLCQIIRRQKLLSVEDLWKMGVIGYSLGVWIFLFGSFSLVWWRIWTGIGETILRMIGVGKSRKGGIFFFS